MELRNLDLPQMVDHQCDVLTESFSSHFLATEKTENSKLRKRVAVVKMTLNLANLPDECICMILSMLQPREVKLVALTFNRRLFKLTAHLIEQHLTKIKEDEAHLESIFGQMKHGRETASERLSRHSRYLDLRDDLNWIDDYPRKDDTPDDEWAPVEEENLDSLIETTSQLGLALPFSFVKMIQRKYWHKLFWSSDWIFLEDFAKIMVPSSTTSSDSALQTEAAYLLTFWSDQQETDYFNLYLDTAGRHAVLNSGRYCRLDEEEVDSFKQSEFSVLSDLERVVRATPDFTKEGIIEDINFEHWLMNGAAEK